MSCKSSDRVTGAPNQFKIRIPTLSNVGRVSLLSASIPNTLYNVTSRNNSLYWNRDGFHTCAIPYGAYNIADIIVALTTAMNTADPGNNYKVLYSDITKKVTITANPIFTIGPNSINSLAPILGYDRGSTGMGESITAPKVVRLDLPAYLLISVDELGAASTHSTAGPWSNFCVSMGTTARNPTTKS